MKEDIEFGIELKDAYGSISFESNHSEDGNGLALAKEHFEEPVHIHMRESNRDLYMGLNLSQLEDLRDELNKAIDFLKE